MSAQVHSRFLSIVQRELDTQGLALPTSCSSQLDGMVTRGVVRLRANNALDNPGQIIQAEQNLRGLVRYFCDYSRQIGTFPTLASADFDNAMMACPTFFPFWSA